MNGNLLYGGSRGRGMVKVSWVGSPGADFCGSDRFCQCLFLFLLLPCCRSKEVLRGKRREGEREIGSMKKVVTK